MLTELYSQALQLFQSQWAIGLPPMGGTHISNITNIGHTEKERQFPKGSLLTSLPPHPPGGKKIVVEGGCFMC